VSYKIKEAAVSMKQAGQSFPGVYLMIW